METIINLYAVLCVLKDAGIPQTVIDDLELYFDYSDLRKAVLSNDIARIKEVRNVGDKRAVKIIEALKDRLPAPMSNPVPDIRKPDSEMMKVPQMNLVYWDGKAKLTSHKVNQKGLPVDKNGKVIRDKDDNVLFNSDQMIKDVGSKRFGPALQMLQKVSGEKENIVFTTISSVQEDYFDPAPAYMMERYWKYVVLNGVKIKGVKWVPFVMGTNAKMKCQIHWAPEKFIDRVKAWMRCGAKMDNAVNIAKIEAYYGLLLPYTEPFLGGYIGPRYAEILPEWENVHEGKNVLIEPDGKMINKDEFTVPEFDGMEIVHVTEKLKKKLNLKRHELRRLNRAIASFKGGTGRGPWKKACTVVGYDIHAKLHDDGMHTFHGRDIDEIAIWGDGSTFKAKLGDDGLYAKFEDYVENFEKLGHRYGVLLKNHGLKKSFLPSQQLQAAHNGNSQFVQEGAKEEVKYLNEAKDPKIAALRYVPRVIAQIAQNDPSIMNAWFATELANNGYKAERDAAEAGRTHNNSVTGLVIKDVIAMTEWIEYIEGVREELPTGCLGKYDVYAPQAGFTGKAVASRNPVIANYGLPVVNVVDTVKEYDKYFDEDFAYIMVGIHDDICKLLRMDHDGDKMRLTNAEWFVKLAESINSDAFADWESFGEVMKGVLTRETELQFFGECTATPTLGLNVDTCGMMISNGVVTNNKHEMLMDYIMNKGTDVKQGADGSNVYGEAGDIWNEMKKNSKEFVYSIAQANGKNLKNRPTTKDKVATEYGENNLDIIAKSVHNLTAKKLVFDGKFDITKVLVSVPRRIAGLCCNGKKNDNGVYENEGVFNHLVAMKSADWEGIEDDDVCRQDWKQYQEWKKQEALKEMMAHCEKLGCTEDDMYDAVTTYIFRILADSWTSPRSSDDYKKWMIVMARTYLEWFGDKLEKVYASHKGQEFLPAVPEGVDVGEDPFDC